MVRQSIRRRGVAAAEMAIVTVAIIVPTLIGMWEVGRLIQVKQIVSNSAREGARLAAQGMTINSSGQMIEVKKTAGIPSVFEVVYQSLIASGLQNLERSDVTMTFQFLAPDRNGTIPSEPFMGERGQPFSVTVTIPWEKVRWVNLGLIRPDEVTYTVTWRMLIDERFTLNETLPKW
jgi:Flp pilus assembly protein TadG